MDVGFFLSFFLGVVINSTLSSFVKTDFENTEPLIASNQYSSFISSMESVIDSRFKLLAADFQDQIEDVKGKVARLEGSSKGKTTSMEETKCQLDQHGIQERQANVDHSSLPIFEKSNSSPTITNEMIEDSPKVNWIPKSCEDLQLLGHQLNGLYLIKATGQNQGAKIETVFCDFKSPTAANTGVHQQSIGDVDVKTKNVHFYVQRNTTFGGEKAVVPFEWARLNEGEAFDLSSGVFTAPVPGIYHFQCSAHKLNTAARLDILLQVNGVNVGNAFTDGNAINSASLTASLRLQANDKVTLFNWSGSKLLDDIWHRTHFTGWLQEEEL